MTTEKTLTGSGAGVILEKSSLEGISGEALTTHLRGLIDEYKFIVLKNFSSEVEDALALMRSFGPLNEAPTRDKGILKLDTSHDEDEVLRSHEALPLHKDGLLTVFDVLLVGIYCMDFRNITGGRTYITDVLPALKEEIPVEHVRKLEEAGFEGLPVDDTGYYARDTAKWHPFPAFIPNEKGEKTLHIGMPHLPGEKESWKVRIPTISQEESDNIFYNMIEVFSNPPYVYYHKWEEGDIIIFDNYRVLHGREPFTGGPRELANIQVIRRS